MVVRAWTLEAVEQDYADCGSSNDKVAAEIVIDYID